MVKKKKPKFGKHQFERPSTAKEAAGKVDYIEDFLGTEEISGTYEGRKEMSRMLEQEKAWVREYNRKKEEKLRKYLKDEYKKEFSDKWVKINKQLDFILPYVLEPTAYNYLITIYRRDPETARNIMWNILPPSELEKLDGYVHAIQSRGHGPKDRVTLVRIIKLERKLKGIKPKIMVERDGKRKDIREQLGARKIA